MQRKQKTTRGYGHSNHRLPEARRRLGKPRSSVTALAVAACFGAGLAGSAQANPVGPTVTNGAAQFTTTGNLLTVTNSPNTIINWGSFSIGANEITRFAQQSASSLVLNRVLGQNPSAILGALQSNGRVMLINPNGIVFGAGSQINVAGLTASTLNITDADFLAGRFRFADGLGNAVINNGSITAGGGGGGGNVYLVGNAVTNNGIITSPNGEVVLAAGNSVELVNPGTPDLRVQISAPDNLAVNLGSIVADSGRVGIYAGLISHGGSINADSVTVGENGQITLQATRNTTLAAGSSLSANGPSGGTVTIQSGDTTLASGTIEAKGSAGQGGSVKVLGNLVGLTDNARIDASGTNGGGSILSGGDFQGKNPGVQNASRSYVGPNVTLKADATQTGDGGKVVVWADDVTRYYGSISAKGGAQSGNGGQVEVSGHNTLDFNGRVDTSAANGNVGTLLLDPSNINIVADAAGPDTTTADTGTPGTTRYFGAATTDTLTVGTLTGALGTTDVTVDATVGGGGNGDINVNTPIAYNSAQALTFKAAGTTTVGAGNTITNNGAGSINFNGNTTINAAVTNTSTGDITFSNFGTDTIAANLTTTGGKITVAGGSATAFFNWTAGTISSGGAPMETFSGNLSTTITGTVTLAGLGWNSGETAGPQTADVTVNTGGQVSIANGATWTVQADTLHLAGGNIVGGGTLQNNATISVEGASTIGDGTTTFNNASKVNFSNPFTLTINAPGSDTGKYDLSATNSGYDLSFSGGARSFTGANATITSTATPGQGGGAVAFSGGTVTFDNQAVYDDSNILGTTVSNGSVQFPAAMAFTAPLTLSGGLLKAGNVTTNGGFTWSGGAFDSGGTLATNGATVSNTVTLTRDWTASGTTNLKGATITGSNTLANTGGIVVVTNSTLGDGSLIFTNAGTVTLGTAVNGGGRSLSLNTSNATLQTDTGQYDLPAPNSSGAYDLTIVSGKREFSPTSSITSVSSAAPINFNGGTTTFDAGATINPDSPIVVNNAGTLVTFNNNLVRTAGITNSGDVTVNNGTVNLSGATNQLLGINTFAGGSTTVTTALDLGAANVTVSGGTLTLNGATTWTGGATNTFTVSGAGTIINGSGNLSLGGGTTQALLWSGGAMSGSGTLVTTTGSQVTGAVVLDRPWNMASGFDSLVGGTAQLTVGSTALTTPTLTVGLGATLSLNSGGGPTPLIKGFGTVQNNGTVSVSAISTIGDGNLTFNNSGSVLWAVPSALTINAGGTDSGVYQLSTSGANYDLTFSGGTRAFTSTSKFNSGVATSPTGSIVFGGATVTMDPAASYDDSQFRGTTVSGGIVTIDKAITFAKPLTVSGGILDGQANLVANGGLNLSGGSINTTGGTATLTSSAASVTGTVNMNRNWIANGTTTISGAGDVVIGNTKIMTIGTGLELDLNAAQAISGSGTLQNNGSIRVQGTSTIGDGTGTFNNAGSVDFPQVASLTINASGDDTGSYSVNNSNGAFDLTFGGGTRTFKNGGSISGVTSNKGGVIFGGAAVTFTSTGTYTDTDLASTKVTNGTVEFDNALVLTNPLTVSGGIITGPANITTQVLNWSGGAINTTAGGTLTTNGLATLSGTTTLGRDWFVAGGFKYTSGLIINGGGSFSNTGGIAVDGDLNLSVSGTDTGVYTVATGKTLEFGGGTRTFNSGGVTGAGTLKVSGGTLSGKAGGTGNISNIGALDWTGGAIDNTNLPISVTGATSISGVPSVSLINPNNDFTGPVSVNSTGAVALRDKSALTLGNLALGTGTLDVTAGGAITQSAGSAVTQTGGTSGVTFTAGANAVTLNNTGNDFKGAVSVASTGGVTLQDANALTLGNLGLGTGTLDVTAGGAITQSAGSAITQTGGTSGATFTAGANAVTLNNTGNDFKGAVSVASTGGVTLQDANALTLGNLGLGTGTLDVTAGGAITQSAGSAITQTGGTSGATFTAGANAVTLNNTGNDFKGAVSVASTGGVTLQDANALTLGNLVLGTGTLDVTAGGAITQSAGSAITQTGGTSGATFTAGANAVTLNNTGNDFKGAVSVASTGGVTLQDANALTLGNLGLGTGTLDVTAGGAITQSAGSAITQTGGTSGATFTAGANAVTLNNTGNDFKGAVSVASTGGVTLQDANALTLGNLGLGTGTLDVTAGGAITQSAGSAITQTGGTSGATFTAGANAVTLNNTGNDFKGAVSVASTGGVTLQDANALTLGNLVLGTGTLDVTAGGAITQGSGSVITQAPAASGATFSAGANSVTLANAGNDFTGVVTVHTTGAGNVALTDANGIRLGVENIGGSLTVTSGAGGISVNNNITTGGAQTYNGSVALGAASKLTTTNSSVTFNGTVGLGTSVLTVADGSGSTSFNNAVDGNGDLSISSTGTTTFGGGVGGGTPLKSLIVSGGTAMVNGGAISTAGVQTYGGNLTIGGTNATLTTGSGGLGVGGVTTLGKDLLVNASAGSVSFTGMVDGPGALTVNSTGTTLFNSAVGSTTRLASLTTDKGGSVAISNNASIATVGDLTFNETVSGNGLTLDSQSGTVSATDTANALGGTLTVNGVRAMVSNAGDLTAHVNTTKTTVLTSGGAINAQGNYSFMDAASLGGGALTLTSTAPTFTLTGASTGNALVNVFANGGNLVIDGNVTTGSGGTLITQTTSAGSQTLQGGNLNVGSFTIAAAGGGLAIQGGNLTVTNTLTNNGLLSLGTSASPHSINVGNLHNVGTLAGTGTINITSITGAVNNDGVVAPGNSPGALSINGDFKTTGTLEMEIGNPATAGFDRIIVSGNADLGGTLDVLQFNNYAPPQGLGFNILRAGSITGTFSTVNIPPAFAGMGLVYGSTFADLLIPIPITAQQASELLSPLLAALQSPLVNVTESSLEDLLKKLQMEQCN